MKDSNYSDLRLVLIDMKSAVLPETGPTFCSVLNVKGLSSLGKNQMDRSSCPSFFIVSYIFIYFNECKTNQQAIKNLLQPSRVLERVAAIKNLAQAAKVSDDVARNWLIKQALWQVSLPAPQHIPRPKFDVPVPNKSTKPISCISPMITHHAPVRLSSTPSQS